MYRTMRLGSAFLEVVLPPPHLVQEVNYEELFYATTTHIFYNDGYLWTAVIDWYQDFNVLRYVAHAILYRKTEFKRFLTPSGLSDEISESARVVHSFKTFVSEIIVDYLKECDSSSEEKKEKERGKGEEEKATT